MFALHLFTVSSRIFSVIWAFRFMPNSCHYFYNPSLYILQFKWIYHMHYSLVMHIGSVIMLPIKCILLGRYILISALCVYCFNNVFSTTWDKLKCKHQLLSGDSSRDSRKFWPACGGGLLCAVRYLLWADSLPWNHRLFPQPPWDTFMPRLSHLGPPVHPPGPVRDGAKTT